MRLNLLFDFFNMEHSLFKWPCKVFTTYFKKNTKGKSFIIINNTVCQLLLVVSSQQDIFVRRAFRIPNYK